MAVERAKVLAALEAKFKGKSVSKNLKDKLATAWAAKIETDDQIDAYVEDREDVVLEASKEADSRVTEAVKKAKEEKKDPKEPVTEHELEVDPDMPKWAKQLIDQTKTLATEVSGIKQSRTVETLTDRFKKDDRLKGVPEFMFKGRIPTKEEDFEAAVTELQTDFTTYATDNKLSVAGKDTPGGGITPTPQKKDDKVDPAIVAFAEKQVKAATEQSKN